MSNSDFPSLEDLLAKKKNQSNIAITGNDNLDNGQNKEIITSNEDEFTKTMREIKLKELEVQTMRQAASLGYPHINLDKFPISQEALKLIPLETVKKYQVVCFYRDLESFRLGALNPLDPNIKKIAQKIEEKYDIKGKIYLISQTSLNRVIDLYDKLPKIKPISKDVVITKEDLEKFSGSINNFDNFQNILKQINNISDLVVAILAAGDKLDASDIHIEAEEEKIIIRFRLDGVLYDAAELEKEIFARLISRIKLIASLKINITKKPQDGRFTIKLPEGDLDVRVSTMPTVFGESIVMRLLRQNQKQLELEDLGIEARTLTRLQQEIKRPNGMIITTGPTGSGKTTTLYAILRLLNKPGVKIITLEDPVEYRLEGINQSQIDKSKNYTFAKGLRSILRQDPDIVMVGEIRDLETAEISIQAALTGHLMLSTLHTNSAAAAIPRFFSMGVKPFLLGPALNCVIGQRLVRRLCPHCKVKVNLENLQDEVIKKKTLDLIEKIPADYKEQISDLEFYEPQGCDKCSGIGYKGRIGIYEIFSIDKEIEQAINNGTVSEAEIEDLAIKKGMISMVQDGILKAKQGITSLEEVFRVIE